MCAFVGISLCCNFAATQNVKQRLNNLTKIHCTDVQSIIHYNSPSGNNLISLVIN